jgi:hypothetical protein
MQRIETSESPTSWRSYHIKASSPRTIVNTPQAVRHLNLAHVFFMTFSISPLQNDHVLMFICPRHQHKLQVSSGRLSLSSAQSPLLPKPFLTQLPSFAREGSELYISLGRSDGPHFKTLLTPSCSSGSKTPTQLMTLLNS